MSKHTRWMRLAIATLPLAVLTVGLLALSHLGPASARSATEFQARNVLAANLGGISVYTWTHTTRADWEQGSKSWVDSGTVPGSLQLMRRLFEASTTITPREGLGNGQTSPDIAVDPNDNAYAVWSDGRNGHTDIYFAYRPAGGSWGDSVRVNDDTGIARQEEAAIAVDASGNAYVVWTDERNGDRDIYYAYRPAGGDWGPNSRVNDDYGLAEQRAPDIAVDASGNAYAVWEDERNGDGDIYSAHHPVGASWSASVRVNDDAGTAGQGGPAIAIDADGTTYAVWSDLRNGKGRIYFSYRRAGEGWATNTQASDEPESGSQGGPDIAVDANGNAHVVWTWDDWIEGRVELDVYAAFRPADGAWEASVWLEDDWGHSPTIAVDASGNARVVWTENREGGPDIYSAYRPVGGAWEEHSKANDDGGTSFQLNPGIAAGPSGDFYAVWHDERNGNPDIYFSLYPAGGDWQANEHVDDDVAGAASQERPLIAVTAGGDAHALWQDMRNGNGDIHSAYRPAGAGWRPDARVNDDSGIEWQRAPNLAVDSHGNAYAAWEDMRDGDLDIYFSYRPAGGSWGGNVRVDDDVDDEHQWEPVIALDGNDNAYMIWDDYRNGDYDVFFAYRPFGGSWGANVRADDGEAPTWAVDSALGVDPAGNVHALWVDNRTGDFDIRFAYRPAGSATWSASLRVNDDTSTETQVGPTIAVDAAGNAIGVWSDGRTGDGDIYAAYRPAGGAWGSNVRVNDEPGSGGYEPAIVVDGSGNAHAVWSDGRHGGTNVYYAARPAGGNWGVNVRVDDEPGTAAQSEPDIALDGSGRIYVVWRDESHGTGHVRFARSQEVLVYATQGLYTSPVLDSDVAAVTWETLSWQGATPSDTSLSFETRSRVAGDDWSAWQAVGPGAAIASPPGQFLQYRVSFVTADPDVSPRLDQVQIRFRSAGTPSAPRFHTPCGVTNQLSPTLTGSAAANAVIHLYVDGSHHATVDVDGDGTFAISPGLSAGLHVLTAIAENGSGAGPTSAPLSLTVEPTLPFDPINVRAGHWSKDGWLLSVPRDESGCANPDNAWRIWPRENQRLRVQVPVSYTHSAAVVATVGVKTMSLEEEGDGLFAGVFEPPIQSGAFSIVIVADGETTVVEGGQVLIDPDGYVYRAGGTISDTLPGVQVTCYYSDAHAGQWTIWDAWNYGQVNAQITLDDGYYAFYTPPGVYRVTAEKEGFTSYTSPDLAVVSEPIRHNVALVPNVYLPVVLYNRGN